MIAMFNSYGQDEANVEKATETFKKIQKWVANDDVEALSRNVSYPFKRFDRLPALKNANEFKAYYSTLFDEEMKANFANVEFEDWKIVTHYTGSVGFELGKIWVNANDKLQSINYQSVAEIKKNKELVNSLLSKIHPSVSTWEENLTYLQSTKFIIRVDYLGDGKYRYASWSKPKSISDKPDLVLVREDVEERSSSGGVDYSFQNGIWTYRVSDVKIGNDDTVFGWSLNILKNGDEVAQYKCEKVE